MLEHIDLRARELESYRSSKSLEFGESTVTAVEPQKL